MNNLYPQINTAGLIFRFQGATQSDIDAYSKMAETPEFHDPSLGRPQSSHSNYTTSFPTRWTREERTPAHRLSHHTQVIG